MLSELEEVIDYKLVAERRPIIRDMWWNRLQGCQRVVEDWQRIMQVRYSLHSTSDIKAQNSNLGKLSLSFGPYFPHIFNYF